MPTERFRLLMRTGAALAVVLVLAACTAGGQFDPTEVVSGDIFNTKKKISGEREPLFPQGVPGAESGCSARFGEGLSAAAGGSGARRQWPGGDGQGGSRRGKTQAKETETKGRQGAGAAAAA